MVSRFCILVVRRYFGVLKVFGVLCLRQLLFKFLFFFFFFLSIKLEEKDFFKLRFYSLLTFIMPFFFVFFFVFFFSERVA